MINIVIIMIPKLWLQLSILLNHDDDDDEHHPNKNAIKIANIIHNMNTTMNFILN
jgi:hypothetical protein